MAKDLPTSTAITAFFTLVSLARAVAQGARLIVGVDDVWSEAEATDFKNCAVCMA